MTKNPDSAFQTDTFSEVAAHFIQAWIQQCQTDHPLCGEEIFQLLRGKNSQPRPKRLLDTNAFQDPERIRLVDTETIPDAKYCALSYSWGFGRRFLMTSSNLADFQREIYLKDLPKTIKDAIIAARGIGIRYLWIDALCIMQDGHTSSVASKEWYDQVSKLHDIFGNSIITIAASESFDGDQGFIKPRNPLSQTICQLQFETNLQYYVIPPCTPYCLAHPFDNARYHLDTRAWVFQERILSPRTVHFTRNFIHLECRTELKCEAHCGLDACHHSGAVPKTDYQTLFSVLPLELIGNFGVELFIGIWHNMVKKYSVTHLCRSEDLLVAMAGLALRLQQQSQLTWSFGLWREFLLRDMLWYVRGGLGVPFRQRAPSWSWASIEVKGPQILYEPFTPSSFVAHIVSLPEISKFEPQSPLSGHELAYLVKVSGPLAVRAHKSKEIHGTLSAVHPNCQGIKDIHPDCPFHPDYELSSYTNLYNFLIARISEANTGTKRAQGFGVELGLVLSPVAECPGRYHRVGYFHHTHCSTPDTPCDQQWPPALFEDDSGVQEIEII